MEELKRQLEVAAHWLLEAHTNTNDIYLRKNYSRVRHECLKLVTANDNAEQKEAA